MIYVDEPKYWPGQITAAVRKHGRHWCHLWTDPGNEVELHAFAVTIGLKRAWFQDRNGFPHYDLTRHKRAAALDLGARAVSLRSWIAHRRDLQEPAAVTVPGVVARPVLPSATRGSVPCPKPSATISATPGI